MPKIIELTISQQTILRESGFEFNKAKGRDKDRETVEIDRGDSYLVTFRRVLEQNSHKSIIFYIIKSINTHPLLCTVSKFS